MKNTQHVNFYRDPSLKGIEISRVVSSLHIFPRHAHDDIYAFSLITSGASYCLGEDKHDLTAAKGQIVLLNPGQVHSGVPVDQKPISYWMLYLDIETLKAIASDILEQPDTLPEFKKMILENPNIAQKFKLMLNSFAFENSSLEKETLLYEFFAELLTGDVPVDAADISLQLENRTINRAKDILSEDLDSGVSLETIANQVGFSRFHFIRQFKKSTGLSPHQFRIQRRIQTAKSLIKKGLPFCDVALETGFSDQSHFTNKFRQYTGATPSQYAHF